MSAAAVPEVVKMRKVTLHGELGELFGREWTFAADRSRSVGEIIRALHTNIPDDFANHMMTSHERGIAYRVIVGGKAVSESSCRNLEPVGSRDVEIVPVPIGEGGGSGGSIGQIILGVLLIVVGIYFVQPGLIGLGIGLLLGGIVGLILAPSDPKEDFDEPGTGFSSSNTVMQEGEVIPVLFGEGLVTGQAVSVEIQASGNGLRQQHQETRILDVISEGPISGLVGMDAAPLVTSGGLVVAARRGQASVYLDDVPSTEYQNVELDQRIGTSDQTPMPGYSESKTLGGIGLQMLQGDPLTQSVSIVGSDLRAVRFNFFVNRLQRTNKKGETHPLKIEFKFHVEDSSGKRVDRAETIHDKILARRNYSYEIDVTSLGSGLVAHATKLTPDSSERYLYDFYWDSIVGIGELQFNYPHIATAGVQVRSEDFSGIPSRKYLARGQLIRIPSNYDADTHIYTGAWDGTFKTDRFYSNNPAWCLFEILTNKRWGLGQWITDADVDVWSLYRAGVFADLLVSITDSRDRINFTTFEEFRALAELNGIEIDEEALRALYVASPLTERTADFNAHLFRSDEAWNVIQDVCSAMFALPIWTGSAVAVMQDRDEEPVYEYNRENVLGGVFEYSGTPLRERTNRVIASYNDAEELFQDRKIVQELRPEIVKYGVREKRVQAIGATSRTQAGRFARWILLTEQLSAEACVFQTGPETGGSPVEPGSVVLIHDPHRGAGKSYGRTFAPDTGDLTKLRLDREVELKTGTSEVDIIMPDLHEELRDTRDSIALTLRGLLPNDDYRLARVWVDTTGDGNPDTRREPNSWDPMTKVLGLTPNNEATVGADYRVSYPQDIHNSDISEGAGKYTELTLDTAPPAAFDEGSVFIVTEPSTSKKKWRVVSVKEQGRNMFEVGTIKHDPSKYSQISDGLSIEDPVIDVPTDTTGLRPPVPIGLDVEIQVRLTADGVMIQDLVLSWADPGENVPGANTIVGYEVTWQQVGGPLNESYVVDNRFVLLDATLGDYKFTVRSRRYDRRVSAAVTLLFSFNEGDLPTFNARVSGLEIEGQGDNTVFSTKDVTIVWRLNTALFGVEGFSGEDDLEVDLGFGDPLLAHFEVIVKDGVSLVELRREIVQKDTSTYSYTYDKNLADGGPRRAIEFEVVPKDNLVIPRSGEGSSILVTNPVEAAIDSSFISLETEYNLQLMEISTSYPVEPDHVGFIFWVGTTPGFDHLDPAAAESFATNGYQGIKQVDSDTEYYWRVAPFDSFVADVSRVDSWPDLKVSIEINLRSDVGPAEFPIDTGDITIEAVTRFEQETVGLQPNFFDGTVGDQDVWKLLSEASVVSRGGVIEIALMFNVEAVHVTGIEVSSESQFESTDYFHVSVANTPKVQYRVARRDGGTELGHESTMPLVTGGPMNITAMGYLVGGLLSSKDNPPVGTFEYSCEFMWMKQFYDIGQAKYTGTVGPSPAGWFEFNPVGARWFTFMFQTETGAAAPPIGKLFSGSIRWKIDPFGPTDWSQWYTCQWSEGVNFTFPDTDPNDVNLMVDDIASGELPIVGSPVAYEIDYTAMQRDELIMDLVEVNMLLMEWAR